MTLPIRLGLTMGDPAGIGPEILLLACKQLAPQIDRRDMALVAIGTQSVLIDAAKALGLDMRFVGAGPRRVARCRVGRGRVCTLGVSHRPGFGGGRSPGLRCGRDRGESGACGRNRRDCYGTVQQGSDQSRGLFVFRSYRIARPSYQPARHGDDASARQSEGQPRFDPCCGRESSLVGDAGTRSPRRRSDLRGAFDARHRQSAYRGRCAQSARRARAGCSAAKTRPCSCR